MVKKPTVFYITESADWVVKRIGDILSAGTVPGFRTAVSTAGIRNSVIHYGTPYGLWGPQQIRLPHPSNALVVTWFHIPPDDGRLPVLPQVIPHVSLWHTACTLTQEKLIQLGVPPEKIVLIPLGVDTRLFRPVNDAEKKEIRQAMGLPLDKTVIGSFQKDGVGWGEGQEPKLIKGPDVFCDVVERLARRQDVFVLLTGPSRGYVKQRLKEKGIPFQHYYFDRYEEIVRCYQALDLYLVSSREEGGPLAVLESMSAGIPVVSTRVGLAPDIIRDGANGFLAEVEDRSALESNIMTLLEQNSLREAFVEQGRQTVLAYDWGEIVGLYEKQIYRVLMGRSTCCH